MYVCIHSKEIGTRKHLLVGLESPEYTWVDHIPYGIWVYGCEDSQKDLEHVSRMFKHQIKGVIPIEYKRMMNDVVGTEPEICWHNIIPPELYKSRLTALVKQCKELASALIDSGYYDQYCMAQKLLGSFPPRLCI